MILPPRPADPRCAVRHDLATPNCLERHASLPAMSSAAGTTTPADPHWASGSDRTIEITIPGGENNQ
jgi:hypothetical protein